MNQPTGIIFREAARADVDTIHALIVELATATDAARKVTSTPEDFRQHGFGDPPAFKVILAERDGVAVGMAVYFFTFSTWRGRLGLYLQDLVVSKPARSQGLGAQLMAETARQALAAGATHIRLSVDAANARAGDFYERCGLSPCTDERLYMIAADELDKLAALS